jgi:hypothetical protein
LRLGFCHRAEENSSPIRTKSLPYDVANELAERIVDQFTGVANFQEVQILSLSPEKADLYSTTSFRQPCVVEHDRMADWHATAEYLCSMDYVLTVDSAVAHLCGVLGVPCTVLLPASSCWRWGLPGEPNHWYGPQMKLYRQQEPLKWIAEDIADSLMENINCPK